LASLPGRANLLARIGQLSGDAATPAGIARAKGRTFFEQRPAGSDNYQLFVEEKGTTRLLIDPATLGSGEQHVSLDWWSASPDGTKLAYGLSKDGSEDSVLHIMDVASRAILPARIRDTQIAYPSWLPDGSGFFYNQLSGKVGSAERYLNARARLHLLGSDPASDPVIASSVLNSPTLDFAPSQLPFVFVTPGSRHALLVLSDERREKMILVAPLQDVVQGKARWKRVADFGDDVTNATLDGDTLYLMAYDGHPRGRVLRTSATAPSLKTAQVAVAESALVLEGFSRAANGLYLRAMDGGVHRVLHLGQDGRLSTIALPFDGTVSELAADPDESGALIQLGGWLTPAGFWRITADGEVSDTGLVARPTIDVSAYTTERRYATAKDGVKVPYTLIYRKDLKRDGANPVFMSAYGAYGDPTYMPFFAGRQLALVEAGAIVGFAHVRGGGEYGRDWHRAGQLKNKPNTWRDLIAVCEDMHAGRYSRPSTTAIGGRSAGGVAVGRALTERPELFAAVVSNVGWHNALRYVAEPNGYLGEAEWGSLDDRDGYLALKSVDSYQAVQDGVRYPAVLFTTGMLDPRVAPFHPAKMAARLQAASTSGKPVLLRVDFDAGHGMGSTRAQQDEEAADTYAFILAQTSGR
jgi:prolyl oligopeptidase